MTIEPHTGAAGAVPAIRPDQTDWLPEQAAALDAIGIGDAPAAQQRLFLAECQRTGLDPFTRQIYMLARRSKNKQGQWETKWTMQTGIDGFRLMAQRSGLWEGTSAPEWCGPDGVWSDVWTDPENPPYAARVQVYKTGARRAIVGVALFHEFTANQAQWLVKPAHMIAKCAEAQAYRKAFPQDFSGLFIPEEMGAPEPGPAPVQTAHLTARRATAERVDVDPETGEIITDQAATLAHIGDLFDQAGITDPDQRLLWVNQQLALADMLGGRPINTAQDLTHDQAQTVIDLLAQTIADQASAQ